MLSSTSRNKKFPNYSKTVAKKLSLLLGFHGESLSPLDRKSVNQSATAVSRWGFPAHCVWYPALCVCLLCLFRSLIDWSVAGRRQTPFHRNHNLRLFVCTQLITSYMSCPELATGKILK